MKKQYEKKQHNEVKIELKQQFPLTIKKIGINGEGVGFFKRKIVFVPGALTGEEVVVEVTKVHPKFTEARIKKIRKKSPQRTKAPCPVYEQCGGCQLQHLSYEGQLDAKRDILLQSLERHTKLRLEDLDIRQTIGMDNPWHYRNKSQFQVGTHNGKAIAGLYSMNSNKLIDIDECIVQHPRTNKVTTEIKRIINDFNIPVFDDKNKKPILKTIVTRVGFETGEVQVVLVTSEKKIPRKELLINEIQKRLPEVVSIAQNINPKKTALVFGDETIHLSGKESIEERLEEFTYELSARAFFQLNPIQTSKLYNETKKAAALTGEEKVVDAYCGVGTIGLWLAKGAKEIRGMDVIKEGIDDAKKNAKKFGIDHAEYFVGGAETLMPKWKNEGWRPDVVVVDPPRTGCDNRLLDTLKEVKPKTFVYVSCNPSTLAKDIDYLKKQYRVEYLQPVDMFPQTAHVEVVAKLVLK
ncbi:23S rRNA (uracil(1939)-C(5))-methyltransferase RlmD [Rossellomorea aquimaris]|uniref:23S rRNA (Uracil(1939)-C(5))-methyltransferase RlmD n=1 Tax=Rossellomorea aquimaris TaxID=189382 RepID=A0A5D4U2Q3_9BACI|nr:23S rRNA (uracil(1939)-C(5))-methyltransferase RlmD [Rossellomorea aquimaris]TYS81512.1 23S rRNA (uracil(1939)-C(5))-methyltransferase RlmD [Rossellomorea aquimaris]TYS88134.1 23S rRNA (uracil(1939)-C(5))-methyltransferase RlmD [Rossellomorea aquimaris]